MQRSTISRQTAGASWRGLHLKVRLATAVFAAGAAAGVQAQEAPVQSGAQPAAMVEEVLVTARRRTENLQDVPISVTAFSGEVLEQRGMYFLEDVANFAPNVNISNGRVDGGGSTAQIYIRGVGQSDFLFPNDPGVGLYVDGVYMARSVGANLALADIESIEILRGPQGTLYGKNSIGGAVKVTTTRPNGEFDASLKVTGGNYDRLDVQGVVRFPVTDTLSGKLSYASLNRDGYVRRLYDGMDLGNENKDVARAALLWEPTDTFSLLLNADVTSQNQNGAGGNLIDTFQSRTGLIENLYNPVVAPYLINQGLPGAQPGDVFDDRWVTGNTTESWGTAEARDDADIWGVSATADWDFSSSASLKSITAYREIDAKFARDSDASPFPIISTNNKHRQEQFSQEFQVSGEANDGRLNWLGGVFYMEEKGRDFNDVKILSGTLGAVGFEIDQTALSRIRTTSIAGFLHGSYALSERFSVSGGVRYTSEDKEYFKDVVNTVTGNTVIPPRTLDTTSDAYSPKISLEYTPNDDFLVYASVARGFKSGGFNPRPTNGNVGELPFDPEFVTTYEVGAKTTWFDRRLVANLTVFYSDYKDMQVTIVRAVPGPDGVFGTPDDNVAGEVENAAKARLSGFELELFARPSEAWELQFGAGYLDNEYAELDPRVPFSEQNELPDAPKWTLNAGVARYVSLARSGSLSFRLDASYTSKSFNEPFNFTGVMQDELTLLNGNITWESPSERWGVAGAVTNILDEQVIVNGIGGAAFGYFEGYFNRPREWSLTLSARL